MTEEPAAFQILLAFDGDNGGRDAMIRGGRRIERRIAALNAWTAGSWEAFDELPLDLQADAWALLASNASERSSLIAQREGVLPELFAPSASPWPVPPKRPWVPCANGRHRDLDSIPTSDYVYVLTGHEVAPGHRCDCPLPDHDDTSHDFALVRDSDTRWCCYGCNRGGTIFQFAALLWGIQPPLRGTTFREVRDRLHDVFG